MQPLLYVLSSPGGAFTDFHVDMGGSCVWYHVVTGQPLCLSLSCPECLSTSVLK